MAFEITLCDEKVYKPIFASPEKTRLSGLSRIYDRRFESKRQKADNSAQRSAFACAKIFGLFRKQKSLLTSQRKKQCIIEYRIYSINRPGRLLDFWTLRVGAYSRLGAY